MSADHIDRARDIIERYLPAMPDQQAALVTRDAARALDAAGLLATPAHDAAVAAKELREAAEAMWACKRPGHWNLDAEPGSVTGYSPDVWLAKRAERLGGGER